jgi:hypothetical protein
MTTPFATIRQKDGFSGSATAIQETGRFRCTTVFIHVDEIIWTSHCLEQTAASVQWQNKQIVILLEAAWSCETFSLGGLAL